MTTYAIAGLCGICGMSYVPEFGHGCGDTQEVTFMRMRLHQLERLMTAPFPIALACPACHQQHVDEGEWASRSHVKHKCVKGPFGDGCGAVWKPSDYPTNGVMRLLRAELRVHQEAFEANAMHIRIKQLEAYVEHIEHRLAHAIVFRYPPFTVRNNSDVWIVNSDDGGTHIEFSGDQAMDEAIREAAHRAAGIR